MKPSERRSQDAGGRAAGSDLPGLTSMTLIAAIAAAAVFVYLLRGVLLPFVVAGIVAYVFTPLVTWLSKTTSLPRWLFALAILIMLIGVAAIFGFLAAPPLFRESLVVGGNLRGAVEILVRKVIGDNGVKLFGASVDASSIAAYAVNGVREWFGAGSRVFELSTIGVAGFFGFILTWVLLGYLLIEGPRVGRGLLWIVPPRRRPAAAWIWSRLDPVLRRYFLGIALVALYASAAAYLGLGLFLGLRHAVVLALLTGVLEIVPLIGPALSAIIAGLAAVQEAKSGWDIAAYVIYATALRISIDQLVGPMVLGRAALVRPVVVIFCFLAGATLFGVVGMVLAVPVALTTKAILEFVYEERPSGT
jgi:predicted PurR-regulated permease PerM